jgi:hypothetical protein
MKTVQQLTETLTWTLDNGTLTIGGTGAMPNYSSNVTAPWKSHLSSITTINIQNGVTTIGNGAFARCSSLTSISIPESVTSIGHVAFEICTSLTSITIPNSVTTIGKWAFYSCSSLASITIPNSVTTIGVGAFSGCISLTSITVSNGNTAYVSENGVLFDKSKTIIIACSRGKTGSYNIPNSVTTIGNQSLDYCSNLTSITIPNSVTNIGNEVFFGCISLTSITVSSGNTAYASEDGVLFNKSKTEIIQYPAGKTGSTYNIPNSVTTIGKGAFFDCRSLTSITIPNSVTTIGEYAFLNCSSLTSITISNSVTTIGKWAFSGCSSLKNVVVLRTLRTTPPALGDDTFVGVPLNSATLTVPKGCKGAYERAAGWKYFGTIREAN